MKEIILVQPRGSDLDVIGVRIPESLLSIATLPYNNGYNIKIIDQRIENDWDKKIIESLKNNPICVGITSTTGTQIKYALQISKLVKQHSNVPIIWGGIHPSLMPEQTLMNQYVDVVVIREGEITFYELVKAIEEGKKLSEIKGICYKENKKIIKNPERPFIENLDSLPFLPYDLINLNKYSSFDFEGKKSIDFTTSRGCPHRCAFCYNLYFNKRIWRGYSGERVIETIKYVIDKYKINGFYFQDDNYCADFKRFKYITENIIKEKLDIFWGTDGVRVDAVEEMDDNTINNMIKSGCKNFDIGVESGNTRILKMINKDITVQKALDVNKKLSNFPLIIKNTLMIGFPTETKQEMEDTIKFAQKIANLNKKAYTLISTYTPYPGTPLYNVAIKAGFEEPKTLEGWSNLNLTGWHKYYKSWLSNEMINFTNNISFLSYLYNKNARVKITNKFIRLLFDVYQPIANYRFMHNFYFFLIERRLEKLLLK